MSGSVRVRNYRHETGFLADRSITPYKWRYYPATKREVARRKLEFITPRQVAEIRVVMRDAERRTFMDELALSRAIMALAKKYGIRYGTVVRAYRIGNAR